MSRVFENMKRPLLILALVFSSLSKVDAEILTFERGGIFNSPGIVHSGDFHLELGALYYERSFKKSKSFDYNLFPTLLRFGLIEDKFELRLSTSGLNINRQDVNVPNIAPGFKIKFLDQYKYKYLPGLELISLFSIPLESGKNNEVNYFHNHQFIIHKNFTDKLSFVSNLTLNFESFDFSSGREFSSYSTSHVFNLNYMLTERLNVFTELFGTWSMSGDQGNPFSIGYGTTYALTDDLAIDLANYFGLNDSATDFGIISGLSYRF